MKTQQQAQKSKTNSRVAVQKSDNTSSYPSSNGNSKVVPDYSSMMREIKFIEDPMGFIALKMFYGVV